MKKFSIEASSEAEKLFLEQAKAMFHEVSRTARNAPDGSVLDRAELCAVHQGRELIRKGLETVIQAEALEVEKKGRLRATAHAEADEPIAEQGRET